MKSKQKNDVKTFRGNKPERGIHVVYLKYTKYLYNLCNYNPVLPEQTESNQVSHHIIADKLQINAILQLVSRKSLIKFGQKKCFFFIRDIFRYMYT